MDAAKIQTANREIETLNERRASVQNIVASFRVMTAEDRRIATLQARVDQLPSRQHLQTKAWVLKNQLDRLRVKGINNLRSIFIYAHSDSSLFLNRKIGPVGIN